MANIFQEEIQADKPKALAEERVYVYVPRATADTPGIASYDNTYFRLNAGKVYLKETNPSEVPSLVKIRDKEDGLTYGQEDGHYYLKTYLKTINEESLDGPGNIDLASQGDIDSAITTHNNDIESHANIQLLFENKITDTITAHNTSETAHSDIRSILAEKVDKEVTSGNFTSKIDNRGDANIISVIGNAFGIDVENQSAIGNIGIALRSKMTQNDKIRQSGIFFGGETCQISSENEEENKSCIVDVKPDGLYVNNNKVETQNNKTSTINSSSTITEYVSAKGVYDFVSQNYVPITFASRLYFSKESENGARLVNTPPTPDNANTLVVTSTNTTFNWNVPTIALVRTLESAIQLNDTNSFAVDLYFNLSRNAKLTFGAQIWVLPPNGSTWTAISSRQSFGEKSYNSGFNSEDIVIYTDLATNVTYPVGTTVMIQLFKKQEQSSSLTTTYYCGVEIDGANVYSFVEFNFANTRINTNQIEDGAVTYDKLGQDVKDMIDDPLPSHTSADIGKVLTVDSNNDAVWDYTKDEFVTFTKTNSSGTLTVTSDDWVKAMNNDKAILRVTDGTDYYVLYKVKYDATTVYFENDTKIAKFIKSGNTYSGTFENLYLTFSNTAVAQADWQSDNTYTGYGYKATLTLTGVTADMIPEVIFGATEAVSGNYLPVAESYAGGIYIYSKVDTAITIPTIILQKAGA